MSTFDLRCGDALEQLKTLPDGSVDLVLTDPPYNIGVQETRAGSNRGAAARDSGENRPCACELLRLGQGRHLPSEELEAARPVGSYSPALMV